MARVLFVENHSKFAQIVCQRSLTSHDVEVVPSIQLARTALDNKSFDIILLDYDLDDGKGTELLSPLLFKKPRPRVIAVSSHEEGNRAILQAGADACCGKLEFDRINEVIESLFLTR